MQRTISFWALVLGLCLLCGSRAMAGTTHLTPPEDSLPLTTVKLYTSGVGYFERSGSIEGTGSVVIPGSAAQLNDVLKSLLVQDSQGGGVSLVHYASRDPLAKALGGFGLDLSQNQSLAQLLTQLRGERVRLAAPQDIEGAVLSVETRQESGGRETVVPVDHVNLVTEQGFRSVAIPQIQSLSILNPRLAGEVQQALVLLAARHDTQQAPLTVRFDGSGRRTVRMAYLMETPVWKTTYRLVIEPGKQPWLQGWALVDNPTDQDWRDIRLSLLSGRPISFTMNLAEPLYAPRPHVQAEGQTSPRPQAHDLAFAASPSPAAERLAEAKAGRLERSKREPQAFGAAPAADAPASSAEAVSRTWDMAQSVLPAARAEEVGSLFQYEIDHPVTIDRHQAAMVPILNAPIEGEPVVLYNRVTHAVHPLNGFRMRNSSPLHFMQGPITVFQGGAYAGDARLRDVAPGEERLITFAFDLNTEVESRSGPGRQEVQSIVVKKGSLLATRKWIEQTTYTVKNRNHHAVTLVLEHPYRPDWTLVDPPKEHERTRDLYRFRVSVGARESATFALKEERPIQETAVLVEMGLDQLGAYLQAPVLSATAKGALQQVSAMRLSLADLRRQRGHIEQQLRDIDQEQHRLRDNMARLDQRSELYGRYVKKLDAQETEVERLRKALADARRAEDEQQRQLQRFIMNLDLS